MLTLTQKEITFIFGYIESGNGTQSAIAAGYSAPTAAPCASRLLKSAKIIAGLALAKSDPAHPSLKRYSNTPTLQAVAKPQQVAKPATEPEKTKHDTQAAAFVDALKTTSDELNTEKSSPELFLEAVMQDENCDPRMRMDAAKALLPYRSKKLAETGKKEEKQQAAKKAGAGKFAATATPPILRAV